MEMLGFGEQSSEYQMARKHSQISPFYLSHIALLGPANQGRCIAVTHYYHSTRCPAIVPSHLLPRSTFLTTLPIPLVPGLKAC